VGLAWNRRLTLCGALIALTLTAPNCLAHAPDGSGTNPRGLLTLDWQAKHISRTVTAGYPDSLGLYAFLRRRPPVLSMVAGRHCVSSNFLSLDVSDEFAFDIDETVSLDLLLDSAEAASLLYAYDGISEQGSPATLEIEIQESERLRWYHLELSRARFANRGMAHTDIALASLVTMDPSAPAGLSPVFTLCGLKLQRSNTRAAKQTEGEILLQLRDSATGAPLAARIGIYDSSGRAVLPAESALEIPFYDEQVRDFSLRTSLVGAQPWPVSNRHVFYIDGHYQGRHPAGRYTLVASRGPEYRQLQQEFEVQAGERVQLDLQLPRWTNQAERGWYSGDVHIHASRDRVDNPAFEKLMQAEDVHVSNLLQMGNASSEHFTQYAWGGAGTYTEADFSLVPGLESPRTALRGHTLALNIQSPVPDRQHYFLYHHYLQRYQDQGAVTGYAHVGSEEFFASRGLALDVPFGLVDFVEVMQNGQLRTKLWYDFLNLGYKLAPAAGSDFPYFDQPGAVRTYVAIEGSYKPDKWFSGLRAGRSYVSNGPLLTFSINKVKMGGTINSKAGTLLKITGSAMLNPDVDTLSELALLRCGEPVQNVTIKRARDGSLALTAEIELEQSMWLALRAKGKQTLAHSGAIYAAAEGVYVGCPDKVPATVAAMFARLDELANAEVEVNAELEYWEVGSIASMFETQRAALQERIKLAQAEYNKLLIRVSDLFRI